MRSANLPDSPSVTSSSPAERSHGSNDTARATPSSQRLHHLDAVRAGALLLGIVLHSLLPFEPGGMWLFTDSRSAEWTSETVFTIHLFRMVLFMTLAGYFARMVLHRRGAGAFLRDRAKRILLPVVVFAPIMVVMVIATVIAGVALGLIPEPAGAAPEQATGQDPGLLAVLNPSHLWFLLVLMEAIVITVAVRAVLLRVLGIDRTDAWAEGIGAALASPAGLLLAAVPYALGLLVQGVAMFGIIQPETIRPELAPTLTYLGAFLVGWFLHAPEGGMRRATSGWAWMLPAAIVLTIAAFLTGWFALDARSGMLVIAAAVQGLASWAWVFALIGLAGKLFSGGSPAVRYTADSSYWIYILHLPLVMAVGIALAPTGLPILVKLLITWTVSMVILVLSYDLMVRSTWVGAWLNGRRRPRAIFRAAAPAEAGR
ncbi:MAG TPA: acyltransferase family protein [Candidatus Brachybacterium merdavium]|uniref:Acyltransferase family protein n=1 Tax=Candidatus Brachybacterium merdavium TaxID=2838513 RepID=A0A9D2LEN3_9MICO|nr:acyltransferase family protein [Candidatus Brachybacterium merdavium]